MPETPWTPLPTGAEHFASPAYYLPHDAPMVLLDQVNEIGTDRARCRVRVSDDGALGPFLDAGGNLPGWYALEIMAQTVGVWSGWHGRHRGESPHAGLLLGARALHCLRPAFPAGSILDVSICLLLRDQRIGSFDCVIQRDGETLATGRLTTYRSDENEINQLLKD